MGNFKNHPWGPLRKPSQVQHKERLYLCHHSYKRRGSSSFLGKILYSMAGHLNSKFYSV